MITPSEPASARTLEERERDHQIAADIAAEAGDPDRFARIQQAAVKGRQAAQALEWFCSRYILGVDEQAETIKAEVTVIQGGGSAEGRAALPYLIEAAAELRPAMIKRAAQLALQQLRQADDTALKGGRE